MTRSALLAVLLVACEPAAELEEEDTAAVETAEAVYARTCAVCHGLDGRGDDLGPDLVERAEGWTAEAIAEVVLYGSGFMDPVRIDEAQAHAVSEYVTVLIRDP